MKLPLQPWQVTCVPQLSVMVPQWFAQGEVGTQTQVPPVEHFFPWLWQFWQLVVPQEVSELSQTQLLPEQTLPVPH